MKEPFAFRTSGKGGALAIHVNEIVCGDEEDIIELRQENTITEIQFMLLLKLYLGNVHRSPSRKPNNCNI